jgi:hypothetical protein
MKKYLLILFVILFSSCDKQEVSTANDIYKGKIVGYLKCSDTETDKTLFGIFIITNKEDSLLSFNVPPTIFDIDTSNLDYGINYLDGDSVQFSYRNANKEEQKIFDCPPSTMLNPTFYPIENFTQVIITEINKIQ